MNIAQREQRQRELPELAHRLGVANAVIVEQKKELSRLRTKGGKDAAYIAELEDANKALKVELEQALSTRGVKLKKFADKELADQWSKQFARMSKMLKAMRILRNKALSDLNRLQKENPHNALS